MAKYLDLDGLSRFKGKADAKYADKSELPSAYIKNASVSGSTLTLTKQDNSTVTFSPSASDITSYGGEQIPSAPFNMLALVNAAMSANLKYKKWILPQSYQSTHTNCPSGGSGTVEFYAVHFNSSGNVYAGRLVYSGGGNLYLAFVYNSSNSISWTRVLMASGDTGIWKHHITLAINEYNNDYRFLIRFSLLNDYDHGYYYQLAYSYADLVQTLYERGFDSVYHALEATGSRSGNTPMGGIYSDGEQLYMVSMTQQTNVTTTPAGQALPSSWVKEIHEFSEEFLIGYRD